MATRDAGTTEARYRTLFERAPIGIVYADAASYYLDANDAACRMLGYAHGELVGLHASDIVVPEELPAIDGALEEIHGDREHRRAWTFRRKDGSTFVGEVIATKFPDGTLLGMIRDVSEVRAQAREVQRVNRLFTALSRVNRAIVEAPTREALFDRICRILVEHGGLRGAEIGWRDATSRELRRVAEAGTSSPQLARAEFSIEIASVTVGAVTVHADGREAFGPRESELLIEVTRNVSAALEHLAVGEARLAAERTLVNEQRFADSIIESLPGILYLYDQEGRFLRWNRNFEILSGYTGEEIARMHPTDFFTPEDEPLVRGRIAQVFATGAAALSAPFRSKDGRLTPHFFTGRRCEFAGRTCLVGVGIDVTEQKRSEAEGARTAQLFRAIVEGTSDAIFVKSTDGKYLLFNEAAARAVGRQVDDVVGRDDLVLHDTAEARTLRANDEAVIRSGRAATFDETISVDGKPRLFLSHKAPLRDASGAVIGVIGISRDITDRRHLEEQLRQSQKMEAVGRLAGGIAHDFNNLLTVIGGYSEQLLIEGGLTEDAEQSVRAIHEAGKRAGQLTRQLLSFSRQAILQPRIVEVNTHIARTATLLRRMIGEDVEFKTVLDQGCGAVRVDPGQLDQVLMNLAVNARDAMPRGGHITLETRRHHVAADPASAQLECAPGEYVMIAMTDDGIGMAPEVVERVFEPFFTTKEPGKGTGLGLSMVFGIVKQSDGAIDVESAPGRGTTFRLYLPVAAEPQARTSDPVSVDQVIGHETILVVEDDDGVRALTVRTLEAQGYVVLVATNGPDAIARAAGYTGRIDLLLTDVVMPQMGGPILAEALKAVRPGLRVIFMSGYTDDAVVRHGLEDATVDFIQKPYTMRSLSRKVRQVLDGLSPEG